MVLVTGSTGLIGSRVCRELGEDYEVVGLDREAPAEEQPGRWVGCDLTSDDSVQEAVAHVREQCGANIASVVHLAAYYDFSGEPSPLYDDLTVEGTRRLLRALEDVSVGQFAFSSSLLVMKAAEQDRPLDETSPVEAEWEYPRSKLDAERVILQEHGDFPVVLLRIAGVYDEDCRSIPIAQQMRRVYEEKLESFFFPGNPDHGQSFVHLDDLARCIRAVVERRADLEREATFLVGEPDVVSYEELQDALGESIHGMEWPTIRIPAPVAKAGAWIKEKAPGTDPFIKPWMIDLADAHFPISIEKARKQLGWQPRHRLRDTLQEMAHRLVADPQSWYRKNGLEPPEDLAELRERRLERVRARGVSR